MCRMIIWHLLEDKWHIKHCRITWSYNFMSHSQMLRKLLMRGFFKIVFSNEARILEAQKISTRQWYFISLSGNHILMWQFMEQNSFYLTWWRFNYHTSTINSTTTRFLHTLQAKLVKFWTMNSLIHISKNLWLDYLPIDNNLLVDINGLIWPQDLITMSSKGISKIIIIFVFTKLKI